MSINRVVLIGNLCADPDMRATQSGAMIAKMRVAVNDRVKGQDGQWTDRPNFFDVDCFGKLAEIVGQYATKGRQVAIEGKLRWREWETQDGAKRSAVSVVADTVQFIGQREGGAKGQTESFAEQAKATLNQGGLPVDDDDIPF